MNYLKWHNKTIKKVGVISETQLYIRVVVFSVIIFGLIYLYLTNQVARNPLNKAVADTSIIVIGISMVLSSICYFWNFLDTKIIYRKHLGLVGFGYAILHLYLSLPGVLSLFKIDTWQRGTYWPSLTGFMAFIIFSLMAIISNKFSATLLGGVIWRKVLRSGYVAVTLVWIHVFLLKSVRIIAWYNDGMQTTPPTGLIMLSFMTFVIIMRILLWISLSKSNRSIH